MVKRIVPIIKATQPDMPMKKARKPKDFSINSQYSSLKIDTTADPKHFEFYEHTFPAGPIADGTHVLKTVNHGYKYIPAGLCMIGDARFSPRPYSMMNYFIFDPMTGSSYEFQYYIDDTKLQIQYVQTSGGFGASDKYFVAETTWHFKYYIFAETGLEV